MPVDDGARVPFRELFWYFLKLGWLAFGGPVGQIGLMHLECVERRRWIDEEEFIRALNFCHLLPGPEATQLAIYIGWRKRGALAGVMAGVLFILPGYLTLCALGWIYLRYGARREVAGVLSGFRPVGLALIGAALLRIGRAALKTPVQAALAAGAFAAFHFLHVHYIVVLLGAGLLHLLWTRVSPTRGAGAAALAPLVLALPSESALGPVGRRLFDVSWFFLTAGLFSFGGAYAVLPYLQRNAVGHFGWLTDGQMIDALALGETTPGPLISIGVFVAWIAGDKVGAPLAAATLAACFLFLPSFVFVLAGARFVDRVNRIDWARHFLRGITSGTVGLMLSVSILLARAAFLRGGAVDWITIVLGVIAFAALVLWRWRLNVVVVVLGGGLLGLVRALVGR